MYVCLCNGFTCRDVRSAIGGGAKSVGAVYRACGVKPNCGRCKESIRELLDEAREPPLAGLLGPTLVAAE